MLFLLYIMKKIDLLPDGNGKLIAVFLNKSLQLGDILTCHIIHHHVMQAVVFGISTGTLKEIVLTLIKCLVCVCPQMEYPVDGVTEMVVSVAEAYQVVRMFLQILLEDG